MNGSPLETLADAAGIAVAWTDAFGVSQRVSADSLRAILRALDFGVETDGDCRESLAALRNEQAAALPPLVTCWAGEPITLSAQALRPDAAYEVQLASGNRLSARLRAAVGGCVQTVPLAESGYHEFTCGHVRTTVAVAPRRCFEVPDALRCQRKDPRGRAWGLSAQLYSLRRALDGGLADYTSLESLAQAAAAQGAAALAISPVHAMFSADPGRFSPYGPSSRLFFNVFHVDPARALGTQALQHALGELPGAEDELARLGAADLVPWQEAVRLRLSILRRLFDQFRRHDKAASAFAAFRSRAGQALQDHACFEAIDAWQRATRPESPQGDWRRWPQYLHDPQGVAVREFAAAHSEEMAFHSFLQWLADQGREGAQQTALQSGMAIGIVADLAVGADPGGSQAWASQPAMLHDLTVGAPPDLLARQGQGWGLGAYSPRALAAQRFAPWLAMLRANLRHSGGVRIDHVLGLRRLWLVPQGASPAEGAYLQYPLDDLLRLTALESQRHEAIVIGEDMGTVPEGFSEQLGSAGVLGIRALWFQRNGRAFLPPDQWPAGVMATTSTHDLATVAGWWAGRDIEWRARLGLLPEGAAPATQQQERQLEKAELWAALQEAGCAQAGGVPAQAPLDEVLCFAGSTPCSLAMVPLEDALGIVEQPNLPGTVESHPNWQQRLPGEAAGLLESPAVRARLAVLSRARGGAPLRSTDFPPTSTRSPPEEFPP